VKTDDIRILRDIEQYYSTQIDEMPMNGNYLYVFLKIALSNCCFLFSGGFDLREGYKDLKSLHVLQHFVSTSIDFCTKWRPSRYHFLLIVYFVIISAKNKTRNYLK
jgi:hypothetical protein